MDATWDAVGCNTNLGILLLCAPLLQAARHENHGTLEARLRQTLQDLTVADAGHAFRAIVRASPAGLGESARLINAVNCVVRRGNTLIGENTDGKGFLSSLVPVRNPQGAHVMLLGAGGAARAIAVELVLAGARKLSIVNRSMNRGEDLATLVRAAKPIEVAAMAWTGDVEIPADIDVLVNCTSIGLGDAEARVPIDAATLRPGLIVADVIPNPPQTRFLTEARAAGCTTLDGLGMLVGQGVLGVGYWSGIDVTSPATADMAATMRNALEEVFS